MLVPNQFASIALACCMVPLAAQNAPVVSPDLGQRIHRVESGLIGPVVIKGDAYAIHNLADRMKELNVPGVSIAVIHEGKIEWARGYGVTRIGGPPVTADTMFQAGSISKPIAAMAALRQVELGKLQLDSDINAQLKSWELPSDPVQAGRHVTLRELLTHTGGITVHGFPGYATDATVPTLVQVLNGARPANTPPIRSEASPGVAWKYSGGGYTIVQQAMIDATGVPFPKLLHDTVLAPIGMTHSTYEQPLSKEFQAFAATPYRGDGKPVAGGAHTYPEMAAAGLWTTPSDIARYAIEITNTLHGGASHVLTTQTTREMLTAGLGFWGLGLEIGGSAPNHYFSHGGVNEGFVSIFLAYEDSGEGAVVMTNSDSGGTLSDEIMHSIAAEYSWPDYHPSIRTVVGVGPKLLNEYAGKYALAPNFDLVISNESGQLMAQATGQNKAPIFAESETVFFPTAFEAKIEFVRDSQGNVSSLILHQGGRDMKAPRK